MAETVTNYQFLTNPQKTSQSTGSSTFMNSNTYSSIEASSPESIGSENLSIALIGPDQLRRTEAAKALLACSGTEVREYLAYPANLDEVPRLIEQRNDVIIIDVRCMRAGAREFLTPPFEHNKMAEALVRAAARRSVTRLPRKTGGRLLVFLGAKGGAGVTTLACNFAVSLAQESGQSTLLIDLDLPLGDAALNLGIVTEYSTVNALQEAGRLDASFLHKLLTKHSSGVSVLAAPGKFPLFHATNEAIDKLMSVARQEFDNVVVDVGARLDLTDTALFKDAFAIYLVTQAGIPELRNSNRLISQFFTVGSPKLEIVVNRYEPRALGVTDETITKALTRPPTWKIPNDYAAVRQMQNTATPLALGDSPIARLIKQMATSICGQRATQPKKKGFRLFG
jgi:pilus assembly protein CpaE